MHLSRTRAPFSTRLPSLAHSPKKEMAVLGPFYVADYSPAPTSFSGAIRNYWRKDKEGKRCLTSIPFASTFGESGSGTRVEPHNSNQGWTAS